jgi:hypothetical protein
MRQSLPALMFDNLTRDRLSTGVPSAEVMLLEKMKSVAQHRRKSEEPRAFVFLHKAATGGRVPGAASTYDKSEAVWNSGTRPPVAAL